MDASCPVMTPEERRHADIVESAEREMMRAIEAAIEAAHRQVAERLGASDDALPAPAPDYFAAVAHQQLFLRLCGADGRSMQGGNPEIAAALIRNSQNIVAHYWSGDGPDAKS